MLYLKKADPTKANDESMFSWTKRCCLCDCSPSSLPCFPPFSVQNVHDELVPTKQHLPIWGLCIFLWLSRNAPAFRIDAGTSRSTIMAPKELPIRQNVVIPPDPGRDNISSSRGSSACLAGGSETMGNNVFRIQSGHE